MCTIDENKLGYLEYLHREHAIRHHRYDEEMYPYHLLKVGDLQGVEEALDRRMEGGTGHLSGDPLRNAQYLFVASIAIACRFAIEGGLEEERSYNISDLYIQQADAAQTPEQVGALQREMMRFYTKEVAAAKKRRVYSKPVLDAMNYIYYHLHDRQTAEEIAEAVGLSANYLSTQFKKELGMTVADYVMSKRIEAAENMLRYSNFAYDEIASILAFSSQSHFIQVFKKAVGCTPREYRMNIGLRQPEFEGRVEST